MYIILNYSIERMMTHIACSVHDTTLHLHCLALTPTYQPDALPTSPNQDRLLRLTCYNQDGFPNSIYEYEQSFINYKNLSMTMIFCVIILLLAP
jgi:hypothetical protein